MAQENIPELRMEYTFQRLRALRIAEMPAALHYPHLQLVCIGAGQQHLLVIVRLQYQCLRLRRIFQKVIGYLSDISGYHEFMSVEVNRIAYRLYGIVRHLETSDPYT